MGFVVFIVCCHFISLYYLPWEGQLLLLQAVQKALSRLFLLFCKDNHFFWESILFLLFFFSFFAPTFVAFAPMFVAFALTFVAFALTFAAFAFTTKFAWEHHKILENPIEKAFTFWVFLSQRVHLFTHFVTFWWIPVKGGFTPWIPSVYRIFGADVKGEPSFLALYAYAKENK